MVAWDPALGRMLESASSMGSLSVDVIWISDAGGVDLVAPRLVDAEEEVFRLSELGGASLGAFLAVVVEALFETVGWALETEREER